MSADAPAAQGLAERIATRERAQDRVHELDAELRSATEARELARAALIQAEREGVAPAQRAKLEKALTEAEARAAERWPERIEGARQAVRDADREVRAFASEHLVELVADLERDGQIAADAVNEAAQAFVQAVERRLAAEAALTSTVSLARRLDPRDYNRSRSDEARAAVMRLLQQGGEVGPVMRIELTTEAAA